MQPNGCFAAESAGALVGTTVTCIFDEAAWIAMVLVDAAFRGRGIGTALLRHAIDFLDRQAVKTIRLDATSLGRPLYEKLGFVAEYQVARYEGELLRCGDLAVDESLTIAIATAQDVPLILGCDRIVTGTDRSKYLGLLAGEIGADVRVAKQGDDLAGYLITRPGRTAAQMGPCMGSPPVAAALLASDASTSNPKQVFLDIPLYNQAAVAVAEAMNLKVQRAFVRMCRGAPVSEQRTRLFASSGPELG
jgi:hypothetical protein